MVSSDEVSEEYRNALSELTRNDKTQINLLTILAEDYASYASEIVAVIEDRLFKCPTPMKIVMLYVLDSIVKNISATNSAYRDLFAKKIVDMIVHVFKESDEKTRASIYRLRCTWGDVFKRSCLYAIDIKINAIDKAWPILHPTSSGSAQGVVHVNPLFLNGKPQQQVKTEEQQEQLPRKKEEQLPRKRDEQLPKKKEEKERPKSWTKTEREGSKPKKEQPQKRKPEPLMSLNVKPPLVAPKQQQQQQAPPLVLPPQQQPLPLMQPQQQQPQQQPLPLVAPQQQPQQAPPMAVVPPQQQQQQPLVAPQQQPLPMMVVPPQQQQPQQGEQPPPPKRLRQTVWPQQQQQYNIQNVTPRLPGVPENNRIFVDGKAYEVFYLDDAAVIERNGLPHRVSFAGPARDVIIDGTAHRMAFGEHKQVLIDGDVHILRFGAPSRELYMGNFAFKGAFGGPPIIATINQRRHEIRLCGPPPEVRIDPEPSYELMRYMPAVRQQQLPVVQPTKTETPSIDVSKLLKRLKETGLLAQQPTEAERKQRERQAAMEAKNAAIASLNAAPIPSNQRLDNIERRAAPMSGLEQFSMRSLIIRYDSIIDAIHRSRVVCQYCGIAFQELYNEAYQRHADWHLQNTIRMEDQKLNKGPKVVKGTRSQPWYMVEEWFNYSETEVVNRTQGAGGQDGADKPALAADDEKETPTILAHQQTAGKNADAPSEIVESKECQMCHEQFEEYWDEEEDVWRLRDCVLLDGKAFHALCREDVPEEPQDRDLRIKGTPTDDSVHNSIGMSTLT